MNKYFLTLILFSTCVSSQDYSRYNNESWYLYDFVNCCLKYKSVVTAFDSIKTLYFTISISVGSNRAVFHRGTCCDNNPIEIYPISQSEFSLIEYDDSKPTKDRIYLPEHTNGSIYWKTEKDGILKYIHVSSIYTLLDCAIFDGVYYDSDGKEYLFDQEKLKWPDRQFEYEIMINLDYMEDDCIREKFSKNKEIYKSMIGYKRDESSLQFYKTILTGRGLKVKSEDKPFIVIYKKEYIPYYESPRFKNLENRSLSQLQYLENEIYARHGYSFENEEYRLYFKYMPWYVEVPNKESIEDELSDKEKEIIQIIQSIEK